MYMSLKKRSYIFSKHNKQKSVCVTFKSSIETHVFNSYIQNLVVLSNYSIIKLNVCVYGYI